MESDNFLHICAALEAMSVLLSEETVPAVLELLLKLFGHPRDHVRKKVAMFIQSFNQLFSDGVMVLQAILAFHTCWKVAPTIVEPHMDVMRRCLCDRNPSVMISTLPFVEDLAISEPLIYRDLVPSLVAILKQVWLDRRGRARQMMQIDRQFFRETMIDLLVNH